ncbi:MAG: leucine-rich repeat domain-containing protein, partial [Phycisphaerae bacterium]|nr:leucine-rich repeat domain-containing protein [Phycisphaerae bacterium]
MSKEQQMCTTEEQAASARIIEQAIRDALEKPSGKITDKDLASLTTLDLRGTLVADLSPLSGLTNLTTLDLEGARVVDLSPLSGLTSLATLYLNGTPVADLSPLSGLTNLT